VNNKFFSKNKENLRA